MPFAQLVIGPPGSGKSTYCDGMSQFMSAINRKCSVVNLDPANDNTSYPPALDVRDLVTLDEIMEAEELGPNGGVLYALEELEHNIEWLENGLKNLDDDYVLFDCPGQVELFTHHSSLRNIFFRLQKLGYRLVVIHLVDSHCLTLPTHYVSSILLSLRSMLQLDLPHLNVLTKIDNLISYPRLPLPLSFYTEARSLDHLVPFLEAEQTGVEPPVQTDDVDMEISDDDNASSTHATEPTSRFSALNHAIIELVEEFGLVGFETLAVEDRQSMTQLLQTIDRAGGYAFGAAEGANETVWQVAMRERTGHMDVRDVEERWIDRRDEYDDLQRQVWEQEGKAEREQHSQLGGSTVTSEPPVSQNPGTTKHDSGVKVVRKSPDS